jgi:hypothetical protein
MRARASLIGAEISWEKVARVFTATEKSGKSTFLRLTNDGKWIEPAISDIISLDPI